MENIKGTSIRDLKIMSNQNGNIDLNRQKNISESNDSNKSYNSNSSNSYDMTIDKLVSDINNTTFDHFTPSDEKEISSDNDQYIDLDLNINMNKEIKDGLLLLFIYILMSQHFIIEFINKYIKIVDFDGQSQIGIVLYGLIMVTVYLMLRTLIH